MERSTKANEWQPAKERGRTRGKGSSIVGTLITISRVERTWQGGFLFLVAVERKKGPG